MPPARAAFAGGGHGLLRCCIGTRSRGFRLALSLPLLRLLLTLFRRLPFALPVRSLLLPALLVTLLLCALLLRIAFGVLALLRFPGLILIGGVGGVLPLIRPRGYIHLGLALKGAAGAALGTLRNGGAVLFLRRRRILSRG